MKPASVKPNLWKILRGRCPRGTCRLSPNVDTRGGKLSNLLNYVYRPPYFVSLHLVLLAILLLLVERQISRCSRCSWLVMMMMMMMMITCWWRRGWISWRQSSHTAPAFAQLITVCFRHCVIGLIVNHQLYTSVQLPSTTFYVLFLLLVALISYQQIILSVTSLFYCTKLLPVPAIKRFMEMTVLWRITKFSCIMDKLIKYKYLWMWIIKKLQIVVK